MTTRAVAPASTDTLVYTHGNFSLEKLFADRNLCDVQLRCKESEDYIPAHACILAGSSELLNGVFNATDKEAVSGQWVVDLPHDFELTHLIVKSFYTGSVHISPDQLYPLIQLAEWLQVDSDLISRLLVSAAERLEDMAEHLANPVDGQRQVSADELDSFVRREALPAYSLVTRFRGTYPAVERVGRALVRYALRDQIVAVRAQRAGGGPELDFAWLYLHFVNWDLRPAPDNWLVMAEQLRTPAARASPAFRSTFRLLAQKVGLERLLQRFDVESAFGVRLDELVRESTEQYLAEEHGLQPAAGPDFLSARPGRYLLTTLHSGQGRRRFTLVSAEQSCAVFRLSLLNFSVGGDLPPQEWVYTPELPPPEQPQQQQQTPRTVRFTFDFDGKAKLTWTFEGASVGSGAAELATGSRFALVLEFLADASQVVAALRALRCPFWSTAERARRFALQRARMSPTDEDSLLRVKWYACRNLAARHVQPRWIDFEVVFEDGDRGFVEESVFYAICRQIAAQIGVNVVPAEAAGSDKVLPVAVELSALPLDGGE